MNPYLQNLELRTRRYFLRDSVCGLGAIAAGSLLNQNPIQANYSAFNLHQPHFAPKAKRVIYLHMTGSPPNLDMFDYKPELVRRNGEDCQTGDYHTGDNQTASAPNGKDQAAANTDTTTDGVAANDDAAPKAKTGRGRGRGRRVTKADPAAADNDTSDNAPKDSSNADNEASPAAA